MAIGPIRWFDAALSRMEIPFFGPHRWHDEACDIEPQGTGPVADDAPTRNGELFPVALCHLIMEEGTQGAWIDETLVRDVVRVQARFKSLQRSRGVTTPAGTAYSLKNRRVWSGRLPAAGAYAATRLSSQPPYGVSTTFSTFSLWCAKTS